MKAARGGFTLVELLLATAVLMVVATLGLRLVYLTQRAFSRETKAGEAAGDALSLAARLRDDLQLARAVVPWTNHRLEVRRVDGPRVDYEIVDYQAAVTGGGTWRVGEGRREEFPRVSADFSGTTDTLVKVTLTYAGGPPLKLTIHPRNEPAGPPPEGRRKGPGGPRARGKKGGGEE